MSPILTDGLRSVGRAWPGADKLQFGKKRKAESEPRRSSRDGEDARPIGAADLADVDWETARFRFTPTLRLFPTRTNGAAIWTALALDETPPQATRLPEAAAIRVWRLDLAPQFSSIDACEQDCLARLQDGASFA
jgi:hypothetical protein